MTISKEERAELRDFIHEVSKGSHGFPRWEYDGSNPFEHPAIVAHTVPDGVQDIGNLPSKWDTQFACAAVNAAPALLDALDASDARIADLEALRDAHRDARERADAREDALKARIAELEAAAQWRPIEEAPRDGTRVLIASLTNKYLPPRVFAFRDRWVSQSVELTDKQAKEHNAVWLPIPALPEGGAK